MKNGFANLFFEKGIYGPKDHFAVFEAIQMVNQGLLFFIPGSGNYYTTFTYIDDVVDAFIKTLDLQNEKINNQIYNIASDDRMTYKEWLSLIARLTGRAKPVIHLPLSLVKPVIGILSPIMNLGKSRTFMYEIDTVNRMTESKFSSLYFIINKIHNRSNVFK
jgi:nucleoside-diphosphate-sugar epimerase